MLEHRQIQRVNALPAFCVNQRGNAAGIVEGVGQLLRRPPCIQRYRDGADCLARPERHHPFRIIAHTDSDAITVAYAVCQQQRCQSRDLIEMFGEGESFLLVDKEFPITMEARRDEHLTQIRDGVLVHR